ncbi:MAG: serine/threonine-protein kinase [Acidobacteriota bacterium]
MDAALFRRVGEIFDAVQQRPVAQHPLFLDEACGDDNELRRQVERLIKHDRRTTGLLDRPAWLDIDMVRPVDLAAGTRLGSYRIDQVIGRGGMGVVYRATRAGDDFQRRVAIKVLPGGGLRVREAWRFDRERQILASLEHPNIARLYDGGTTGDGQPYLVLEYVDGLPLTTYCDRHRLSGRERLELFLRVCAAVRFAHRNLVVHRDLKPGNILVDAEGEPKLLDFGIAKLLSADPAAERAQATQTHQRVMTLSHASPEQMLGEPITTASDVYCLGLILYELLCGVSPFAEALSKPYELLRRMHETGPPRLTQALASRLDSIGPSATEIAALRSTSLPGLRKMLRGDLDTITSKALRHRPEQRYADASELADDVTRYLEDRPILAGSPGAGYRLGKFLRRHRAPLMVAAIASWVIVGLVGAFISTLLDQVGQTEREKNKAERLAAFLTETFAVTNPEQAIGETVTARALLDAGAQRLATELEGEPEIQALMLDAMGRIYQQIGLAEPALELLSRAVDLRLSEAATAPADLVASLTHLGAAQAAGGRMEDAERTLRDAVKRGARLDLDDGLAYAHALESLGLLRRQQYDFDAAESLFRQALDLRQRAPETDAPGLARLQEELGTLMQEQGRFKAARTLHGRALESRRAHFGNRHPEVAKSLQELARVEHLVGRFASSEALYRQALAIDLEVHGERHQRTADAKNALALMLQDWGHTAEALVLLREAAELTRQLSGETTEWATMASNLAVLLTKRGHYEEAEELFAKALDIRSRALGERHPLVGQTLLTLGRLYRRQGRLDLAEDYFTRATVFAENLPAGHRARAYPSLALAHLLLERGQGAEAEALLLPALRELGASHTPGHWRIAMARADLGRSRQLQDDPEAAEQLLLQALDQLSATADDDSDRQHRVRGWLAHLYREWGKPERAKAYEARASTND